MKRRSTWLIGIGISVLVLSLSFNWYSENSMRGYAADAQGGLMGGEGFIMTAEYNLSHGDKIRASLDAYEGIGYLQSSSNAMNQMGVHGVAGLAMFLNVAMYSLLGYTNPEQVPVSDVTKQHYEKVIHVFIESFKPFGRINYGSISNQQLQQAINLVYQAMTPQERQQFSE